MIAGVVIGGTFRSRAGARRGEADAASPAPGCRLQLPTGWTRGDVSAIAGLRARAVAAATPTRAFAPPSRCCPPTSPTLLPASLTTAGDDARDRASVGSGYEVWRYRLASPKAMTSLRRADHDGDRHRRLPRPTARTPALRRGSPRRSWCRGSRRLEPAQRAAFFSGLPPVVSELEAARAAGVRALDGGDEPDGAGRSRPTTSRGPTRPPRAASSRCASRTTRSPAESSALAATASAYTALGERRARADPEAVRRCRRAVAGADADLRSRMSKVSAAVESATLTAPPRAQPVSTPAAKPAVTPAATPASTPVAKATSTPPPPRARPRRRRRARRRDPGQHARGEGDEHPRRDAERPRRRREHDPPPRPRRRHETPAASRRARAAEPKAVNGAARRAAHHADLRRRRPHVPLLLLFGAVALFFAIRGARRTARTSPEQPARA